MEPNGDAETVLLIYPCGCRSKLRLDALYGFAVASLDLFNCLIKPGLGRSRQEQETGERHEEEGLLHTDRNPITVDDFNSRTTMVR
jgi:hypothetical protein